MSTASGSHQLEARSTNQEDPLVTTQSASVSGMERQLSVDTAKDQHSYRSWNRAGVHQQMGPTVTVQTIPARGANADGVTANWLHISVRRHYKEKGVLCARWCLTHGNTDDVVFRVLLDAWQYR